MFDSLSGKLQNAFRNLRGLSKISESNASEALREVRLALLEADVNFKVARDFIERVKVKALGLNRSPPHGEWEYPRVSFLCIRHLFLLPEA